MMKNFLLSVFLGIFFFCLGFFVNDKLEKGVPELPILEQIKERPFEKYAFEKLFQTQIDPGVITVKEELKKEETFTSNLFEFEFNPSLDGKTMKVVTGQINIPFEPEASEPIAKNYPLVVMFRGYIDQTLFRTGDGTRNASRVFAENGFITLAPDFLGYGGSNEEAGNIFETRFQTYVTAVALLNSLNQIQKWDGKNAFLWGHSNGGQVALTTLEITGKNYPTTLWAPVSKPFPYSVLFYTDESEDEGELIRSELSKFEEDYDTNLYSLTNYLDRINAPIQIQQGTADEAVPKAWSDKLVTLLEKKDKEVDYHTYPATDHNMRPSWDSVIEKDLVFFKEHLK
jgi:dipeptidyl aminopeptidase/acylaminoacyl peptidase